MYCFTVLVFSLVMIYFVVPKYGRTNPIVYISICSLVGSISVMAIKGFGVAVKLTLAGNNQFTRPATYVFAILVAGCIVIQTNYLNKALDTFSTNVYVRSFPCLSINRISFPVRSADFPVSCSLCSAYPPHALQRTDSTPPLSLQSKPNVLRRLLDRDNHSVHYPLSGP